MRVKRWLQIHARFSILNILYTLLIYMKVSSAGFLLRCRLFLCCGYSCCQFYFCNVLRVFILENATRRAVNARLIFLTLFEKIVLYGRFGHS